MDGPKKSLRGEGVLSGRPSNTQEICLQMYPQVLYKAHDLLGGRHGMLQPLHRGTPKLSTKTQALSGSDVFSPHAIHACLCLLARGTRRVAREGISSFWSSSKVCFLIRVLVT